MAHSDRMSCYWSRSRDCAIQSFGSNSSRIKELEGRIKSAMEFHEEYQDSVSDHFEVTSKLIDQMTKKYKEVYEHLAIGAQDLCSTEVAKKLLPTESDAVFEQDHSDKDTTPLNVPKDYVAKSDPDQAGALSESFSLKRQKQKTKIPTISPILHILSFLLFKLAS
ncbi:MAG: YhcB family protein [Pseudohongiellaceae bacterium]